MPRASKADTARQAREVFLDAIGPALAEVGAALKRRLDDLLVEGGSPQDIQRRQDAWVAWRDRGAQWQDATRQHWRASLTPPQRGPRPKTVLALMDDDALDAGIAASRLALHVQEQVQWEFNDLRLRLRHLEGGDELAEHDVVQPLALARGMVQGWEAAGLPLDAWRLVRDAIEASLGAPLLEALHAANEFLIGKRVLPEIDLRPLMKRARDGAPPAPGMARAASTGADAGPADDALRPATAAGAPHPAAPAAAPHLAAPAATRHLAAPAAAGPAEASAGGIAGLRQRIAAQAPGIDFGRPRKLSISLARAFAQTRPLAELPDYQPGAAHNAASAGRVARALRQQGEALREQAADPAEKAIIEVVALMFQAILAEERIVAALRVWFARLQIPVLRVALAEPAFFEAADHPARRLIDRIGACVLGFDAAAVEGSALESEVRRVVQVIEQYPESGRRVFELLDGEFQQFLSGYLADQDATRHVVGLAQQVEQKETLSIQCTIELRRLLEGVPVPDGVRDFLFQIWVEVLAITTFRHGPQQADTLAVKRCAIDLVWAASAKPSREERARVIREVPGLLERLRAGMALLGMPAPAQEQRIATLGKTLTEAFMSRTDAIEPERIASIAARLENIEEVLTAYQIDELSLDSESLQWIAGQEASRLQILHEDGEPASDAALQSAREQLPGQWFWLAQPEAALLVQHVWRSHSGQLHLLAAGDGRCFLIQVNRLAVYLQAGWLRAAEAESLTERAAREANARLQG